MRKTSLTWLAAATLCLAPALRAEPIAQGDSKVREINLKPFSCLRIAPISLVYDPALKGGKNVFKNLTALFHEFSEDFPARDSEGRRRVLSVVNQTPAPQDLPAFAGKGVKGISPEAVKAELSRFEEGPDGVRVCFVVSHGTHDAILLDQKRELPVEELIGSFYSNVRQKPHLAVLIIDACRDNVEAGTTTTAPSNTETIWKALYFGHQGFVLLRGTSDGQKGLMVDGESLFLRSFIALFDETVCPRESFGIRDDELLTWTHFFEVLQREYRLQYEETMAKKFRHTPKNVADTTGLRPIDGPQHLDAYNAWVVRADLWKDDCSVKQGAAESNAEFEARLAAKQNELARRLTSPSGGSNSYGELDKAGKVVVDSRIAGPPKPEINEEGKGLTAAALARALKWRRNDVRPR